MKNFFKYAMMIVAVVMSVVLISSCSKDDDNNSGGDSSVPNNTIVLDGKQYPIQEVEVSSSRPDRKICFVNTTNDIAIEIERKDGSAFTTSFTEQQVEIEVGKDAEGYANVKISYDGGTKYKVLCSNVKIGSHTLSVSFDGDANDFKGSDK